MVEANQSHVERYVRQHTRLPDIHYGQGRLCKAALSVPFIATVLREQGILSASVPVSKADAWLARFDNHLMRVHGLSPESRHIAPRKSRKKGNDELVKVEILCRNPAGPEGPPGKGGDRPEVSIGESSEMAASSVCSEHKSRVIEPRNIQIAGAFVFMSTGAAPERQMPSAMVRPGSKSRANVRKGSLGTWEILLSPLLLNQKRDDTGRTTTWHTGTDLAAGVSKRAKHQEVLMAERNEAVEKDRGSRSALIVAPESRETDPRKPVSSQGGRRFTELPLGNTR